MTQDEIMKPSDRSWGCHYKQLYLCSRGYLQSRVVEVGEAVLNEDVPVREQSVHHRGVVRGRRGRGARPRGQHRQCRQYNCLLECPTCLSPPFNFQLI